MPNSRSVTWIRLSARKCWIGHNLQKWCSYLLSLSEPFEVLTDHNALKYFMSSQVLTHREARWAEFLSKFNFTNAYQPGKLAVRGRPLPIITLIIKITLYSKDYSISKNDLLLHKEKIVVPDNPSLKLSILKSRHDFPLASNFGQEKTYSLISQETFSNPTSSLALTLYGFHFPTSSMSLFIQTKTTCTSFELSDLFFKHVFSKHGLPDNIASLCQQWKIQRNLSTAYHPESDRQTERVNQILKQYLQMFICYRKMIGASGSLWQNLPTTMQLIPQLNNLLFKLFMAEIQSLTLSMCHPLLLPPLIVSQPANATSNKPINFASNLPLSTLVILSVSVLATFEQQDQPQNFQKESLVHSKLN
ncbi:hypothetical protein VP01_1826g4 [Puccinia sorghi]|uniref:Reverse transcriptase RNase H-like domain-containing protein n=1 Tax=Puccinia sorghi TaxID=27349 RepID=A0A0L6VDY8_9BASI|nr:hypothetical protein VP01_1826g4 [Puccinia sorghi]